METRNGEVHVETDEARGGSTPNIVRWVLGISLLAAIVLLSIVWMTGAATSDADDPAARTFETETAGTSTDGIVNERATDFQTTPAEGAIDPNRVENRTAE